MINAVVWVDMRWRHDIYMLHMQMDKASIVTDAIEYIQHLQEQEKSIQTEISELESDKLKNPSYVEFEQEELPVLLRPKKKRTDQQLFDFVSSRNSPIQVLEVLPSLSLILYLSVSYQYCNGVFNIVIIDYFLIMWACIN